MRKNNKKRSVFLSGFLLVVLPFLALAVSSAMIYEGVRYYIKTSHYFKVRSVRVEGITDAGYIDFLRGDVVGDNIFSLDLKKRAEAIQERFPTLRGIRVTRVLPSELLIEAHPRSAVAALRRQENYLLDAEGVAIASVADEGAVDVPVIVGLEDEVPRIRIGATYASQGLNKALRLAEALAARGRRFSVPAGLMKDLVVTADRIEAADPANLCFYLNDAVQVKIGDRDFARRLNLLPSILRGLDAEAFANLRYIDLRLKEPVIASKQAP